MTRYQSIMLDTIDSGLFLESPFGGGVSGPFDDFILEGNLPPVIVRPRTQEYALNGVATSLETAMGFGRTSEATRVNESGNIEVVASGVARINHDRFGQFEQILMEAEATNLIPDSGDPTAWNVVFGTVTANSITGPTGATEMAELRSDNGGGSGQVYLNVYRGAWDASTTHTASIFVKKGSDDWCGFGAALLGAAVDGLTYFNLATGAVGTQHTNHSAAGIEDWGGGIYRISVTFTTDTDVTGRVSCYIATADGVSNSTPRDANHYMYQWGMQIEASALKTSYIPTSGGAAPRAADTSLLLTSAFAYSDTEGTVLMEWAARAVDYQRLFTFYKDATHEIFGQRSGPSNNIIRGFIEDVTTVGQIDLSTPGAGVAADSRQSVSWIAGSLKGSSDGVAAVEDTVGVTIPSGATKLAIAEDGNGNLQLGGFREFIYHSKSLLQATQDTWTTGMAYSEGFNSGFGL